MDDLGCGDCAATLDESASAQDEAGWVRRERERSDALPRLSAVRVCPGCSTVWERTIVEPAANG